ncbi:MAG TPA: translocation/assembly module TamB domain-containing protein [Blastocatellia bacterium]|nr:translocation/assembly module TamB domain-containing protein [Blastocatellia bacterium]
MRRKLLIGAVSVLSIILILALAVFWYIRSGRLDLFLQSQVIDAMSDFGIRAEIGSTKLDLRGYRVTLNNIKLYADKSEKPFGEIESLAAEFSVVSYLRREANITKVHIGHPQVWVAVDAEGKSNLDALHAPPSKEEEKKSAVTFLTALFEIEGAELHYDDLKQNISAVVPGLNASLTPREPRALEDKLNHLLALNFDKASAVYEGRKIENIKSSMSGLVLYDEKRPADQRVDDLKFDLSSDFGTATASGNIESLSPLKYNLGNLQTTAHLEQVARVFAPGTPMKGTVSFTGNGNGTGADYQAEGELASDSLAASNVQVTGLKINTTIKGTGADYQATGEIQSTSLTADGIRVAGVRVKTDVNGTGDEYNATADLTTGSASGHGVTIGSIRLNDAKIKGKADDFDARAAINVSALKSDRVTVSGLRGRLAADRTKASLEQFTADALGGNVSGSATLAYGGGSSSVDVQFKSIDLDQAATAAAAKDVKIRGTANGAARLTFPGVNYKAATGRIDATFNAAVSPPASDVETLPGEGQVSLVATGRGFNIERAFVRSRNSEVTATGTVGWNGESSLNVNFKSQDMAEVQRVIEAFGLITDDIKSQYPVEVTGPGEFVGRVEGKLAAPAVTGHVKLANIVSPAPDAGTGDQTAPADQQVGAFEGDIAYSPSLVRVENASLVRDDGSRADFSVIAPLDKENAIAVKANVQNFDLPTIIRAASPGFADFVGRGTINGTIDLTGLPGPRTIEGTAKLSLSAGEFNLVSTEEGKDAEKISVPEFTGDITIANSELSVQDLRMRVGDSDIKGEGRFNLDTYAYSVNAEGKNIDLARLSDAVSENVKLAGSADVNVTGQGKWGSSDDWSELNLNATIQGRGVAINGRDVGDAKIVAFTESGLLKVEATGNILDQPRTLAATIDLRDRKNYPISANVEFTDTDIGPYLALVAPELGGVSGRASGSIKLSGPLQDPDQIQAVANLSKLEFGGAISERQRYTISNQGNIVVTASPKGVTLDRVQFVGEGTSITLEGTVSREGGAKSNLAVKGEVNLRLVSSFVSTVFTTGVANVDASIVGALDSPQLLGVATLKDVGVRVVDFPLSIARGNGQVRFTSNQALIENFTAASPGGGTIAIEGGAALVGLVPDRWSIQVNADQVGVEYPHDTQTVIDAKMALRGNRKVQVVTGDIEVRRASYTRELTLEELIGGSGPFAPEFFDVGPGGGGGGGPAGIHTTLDLRITADNTLSVKNNIADAVGTAYLNVRGPVEAPIISGRVMFSRGTIEFRRGRFELSRGLITLPGGRGADPVIDVQSEADISGYHVTVAFSGPLPKLQTVVKSDPPLPEVDIVSLVLTGSISGESTTVGAVTQTGLGLAQSLLSASLSEQLERGTQRLFGLSRFSIDPLLVGRGSDPTARVTIGQRITKDLTVTYSQNLTSGPSGIDRVVLIEYRLSNRFSVVGYRNERGELGFDVRLRKRF